MTKLIIIFLVVQILIFVDGNFTSSSKKWPSKIDCLLSKNQPNASDIQFLLYTPYNKESPEKVAYDSLYKSKYFNPTRVTKIIIHGYAESCNCKIFVDMKNAYLEIEPYNVVLLDWRNLAAAPCYLNALNYTVFIGRLLGLFLQKFLVDRVHIIGFSLGAHIAGIAGQLHDGQISRITGLDPANPWPLIKTHPYPQTEKLDKGDALNVDIIHTSHLAYVNPQGDADFYVNKLKRQPGCPHTNLRCYHKRSVNLFVESIQHYQKFKVMECETYSEYKRGNCSNESDVFMGDSWLISGGKPGIFSINITETDVGSFEDENEEDCVI